MLAVFLFACAGSDTDSGVDFERPPEICNPETELPNDPYFVEQTAEVGLDGILGSYLNAVDYDGDGWTDLVVNYGDSNAINDFGTRQINYLLHNEGGKFVDQTEASGWTSDRDGGRTRSFVTSIWGDVDNDGDLDAFQGYFRDRNNDDLYPGFVHEVVLNDGAGHFSLAAPSDVELEFSLGGASFVDFDRDGFLDLWLVGWYVRYGYLEAEQDRLLRGNGDGTFDDVTEQVGLGLEKSTTANILAGKARLPGFGAAACDVDGDGDADLLASNYGRGFNQLWINDGGSFAEDGEARGYWSDDNLDYTDNQFYACYCERNGSCDPDPGPARISCDSGAWSWTPGYDDKPARLGGNTFATVCGDIDNDGDFDLLNTEIVHWHIGDSSDRSQLLINDGNGHFTRPGVDATGLVRERKSGWNEGDLDGTFVDYDNDGWKDIWLSSSDYPGTHGWLFHQESPTVFTDETEWSGLEVDSALGVAVADFDHDGDQDVVATQSTARGSAPTPAARLFRNDLETGNHAHLELIGGAGTNLRAIGARVTVETDATTQTFEVTGGFGHGSVDNGTDLHVGLGDACRIRQLTVRWPDATGSTDTWTDLPANYDIVLHQGGAIEFLTP